VDPILGDCSLANLRRRRSYKWATHPGDVLPAFVAEMDFDLAEPLKVALREAIDRGDCGYAKPVGIGEAYAEFSAARHRWSPAPENVVAVPDVMTAIVEVIRTLTPVGSGIVINPPVYPQFFKRIGFAERAVVPAPLRLAARGRYELDLAALDEALSTAGVAAYLLCSPHNPVGRVWSEEDLLAVADLCREHRVLLLVDEIHAPLTLPGTEHTPFLSLDHEGAQRALTFTSASKGWNIPGLKCGLAVVASDEYRSMLDARWEALLAGHLGVLATIAAFRHGTTWLEAVIGQLDENRSQLSTLLTGPLEQVVYFPPEASFLAWLDCRALALGDDPAARFLDKGRVALSPGPDFGEQGQGFVRLNMGTSPDLLADIVHRMRATLAR
jgi:cysteine-S-conjugate beta-lyase